MNGSFVRTDVSTEKYLSLALLRAQSSSSPSSSSSNSALEQNKKFINFVPARTSSDHVQARLLICCRRSVARSSTAPSAEEGDKKPYRKSSQTTFRCRQTHIGHRSLPGKPWSPLVEGDKQPYWPHVKSS